MTQQNTLITKYDYLLTGCFGFIATNFLIYILEKTDKTIYGVDFLGVGNNFNKLLPLISKYQDRFHFDICDISDSSDLLMHLQDKVFVDVIHMAANSHVDRSLQSVMPFVYSNVVATAVLLEHFKENPDKYDQFLLVSTDEVVAQDVFTAPFKEEDKLNPRNPYSATKAASELLCNSFIKSFGMRIKITRCSNNYGPYQATEKYLPKMISNLLQGQKIGIYGVGSNEREWIFVLDHIKGILLVLDKGLPGEIYHIGSDQVHQNLSIYKQVCQILNLPWEKHYQFVPDRPGHDSKYFINAEKIKSLGFDTSTSLAEGLSTTVEWYKNNVE